MPCTVSCRLTCVVVLGALGAQLVGQPGRLFEDRAAARDLAVEGAQRVEARALAALAAQFVGVSVEE